MMRVESARSIRPSSFQNNRTGGKAQRITEKFEGASKLLRSARQVKEIISDMHQRLTGE
jgi:hypothetical protein